MPRPRKETPEGIEIQPINRLLDRYVRESHRPITEIADDAKISKTALSNWLQGWRTSRGAVIPAVPADDDELAGVALALDILPRDLEDIGYGFVAMIVRESNRTAEEEWPLERFTTKQIVDELARRFA